MWRRRIHDAVIVFLLGVGMWMVVPAVWEATRDAYDTALHDYVRWSDARPPRPLRERKGDRQRHPRRGFGFALQDGLHVDTFAGTATNMRGLPDTTIELRLSDAQLDTLYGAVIHMRLFDDRKLQSVLGSHGFLGSRLTLRAGASTKALAWDRQGFWAFYGYHREPLPDEWKRFDRLLRMIDRMVEADSAYRALPKHWVAFQ
jgi:hypothetical protein